MRVLNAAEMRAVDRRAIDELGIPGLVLMENAAIGVADAIGDAFPHAESVHIFCGPGNNGGDGLALARHLEGRGYRLRVVLAVGSKPLSGDAGTQLEILARSGFTVERLAEGDDVVACVAASREADLIVDALFGTGLTRPLEGRFAELVGELDALPVPIVAVDVASGLDGSSAEPPGPYLAAALTVTFAAPKVAHVLPPAADAAGRLVVADLGIPSFLVAEAPGTWHLIEADELGALLRPRGAESHKGSFGHCLLVAGGRATAGAAVLAAQAAVRGGAGLLTCAVPASARAAVVGGSPEAMTVELASDADGLAAGTADALLAVAEGKSAVGIGPGLGTAPGTVAAVRQLVGEVDAPVVLDADGLNAFAGRLAELAGRDGATVLTPHPGELGRLLGITTAEVQADRPAAARRAATESGAVVALKGHRTLVANPDGELWINATGNPGMATGGSGDVLTGLMTALVGRCHEAAAAARLAVWLHGTAGDLAAAAVGEESLRARDLVAELPRAFAELAGGR